MRFVACCAPDGWDACRLDPIAGGHHAMHQNENPPRISPGGSIPLSAIAATGTSAVSSSVASDTSYIVRNHDDSMTGVGGSSNRANENRSHVNIVAASEIACGVLGNKGIPPAATPM
jgi:hypothetical protein